MSSSSGTTTFTPPRTIVLCSVSPGLKRATLCAAFLTAMEFLQPGERLLVRKAGDVTILVGLEERKRQTGLAAVDAVVRAGIVTEVVEAGLDAGDILFDDVACGVEVSEVEVERAS